MSQPLRLLVAAALAVAVAVVAVEPVSKSTSKLL